MERWYVLRTEAGAEKKVEDELKRQDATVYLPLDRVMKRERLTRRPYSAEVARFPGYLFVAVDVSFGWQWLLDVPRIVGMLCRTDGTPCPVRAGVVELLRGEGVVDRETPMRRFSRDMRMRISGGVLDGYVGRYVGSVHERIILLLDTGGAGVRITLPEALVVPA